MKESMTEDGGVRFEASGWCLHEVVHEPKLEGSDMVP
jgi:hypothetical protein